MIPNPIRKVLSSMSKNGVQTLLMGGQACVLYGAAEFSRDTDFAVAVDADNLQRLRRALDELQANVIAVPPFELQHLERGHSVHFRCHHPDALGMRVDLMSRMRGVDDFLYLWERRTTLENQGETYELLSLPDLIQAKKTQRDKDWPMIRRLVETHYFEFRGEPTPARIAFWLREARTPSILREIARQHPAQLRESQREVLNHLEDADEALERVLRKEEDAERAADRVYWAPLKAELQALRWKK